MLTQPRPARRLVEQPDPAVQVHVIRNRPLSSMRPSPAWRRVARGRLGGRFGDTCRAQTKGSRGLAVRET